MVKELFGKLFRRKLTNQEKDQKEKEWYDFKFRAIESILGKPHDNIMHSLISFYAGGALHLHYYPNGIEGTGIVTKELSTLYGTEYGDSPKNNTYDHYELVMFTKEAIEVGNTFDVKTQYSGAEKNIRSLLNTVARFSFEATLNPNETCEFPESFEEIGGKCLIFDSYGDAVGGFGLMLVIEIFRSEMKFAMENSGTALLSKLKESGYYPYSDMDRDPVV